MRDERLHRVLVGWRNRAIPAHEWGRYAELFEYDSARGEIIFHTPAHIARS